MTASYRKMNMMIVGVVYYVGVILQLAFCDETENSARVTNEVQMTFKLDNYQGLLMILQYCT